MSAGTAHLAEVWWVSALTPPRRVGSTGGELSCLAAYAGRTEGTRPWWVSEVEAAVGVHVSVASDAGVRFTLFREFSRSVECTMHALGLPYSEAIAMSTLRSDESLGVADRFASMGKAADFVVLDGVADETTRHIGPIRQVWRDGVVVVDGGRLAVPEVTS